MSRTIRAFFHRLVVCLFFFLIVFDIQADEKDVFERKIRIVKNRGTVYELLKQVSDQSGYLFIYDSRLIDNDRKVKIPKGDYPLREAIYQITGNRHLQIDLKGEHLLLRQPHEWSNPVDPAPLQEENTHFSVEGLLIDQETEAPIPFASIGLLHAPIATITNQNGYFQLVIPDSLGDILVHFSHIGYESREIDVDFLRGAPLAITLRPQVILLDEVVISAKSPMKVLGDMLDNRSINYASDPVCLTTFYREGINAHQKNIDLTESVLQVYKAGYQSRSSADQVKLIKKRRIVNRQEIDTIFPKMKSGVNSCLILDIVKELPEFLEPDKSSSYLYAHTGMTVVDGRLVDVIFFKQKEYVEEPLYTGELFIEAESKALVEVRFEINPRLIRRATNMFVDRKTAGLKIDLLEAKYLVSYKPINGKYYVNHIRGDISLKVKRKRRLFGMPLHFWFEMVTCKIDTEQIQPFPRNERLSASRIFAETKHGYDRQFWENFNIILPEEELKEAILHSLNDVLISEE